MTFQLIVKKTSVGDIIPESKIIADAPIAIMLLHEGKMKKNKYAKTKSINDIFLGSNI